MGCGSSTEKIGDLLEVLSEHDEAINCLAISEDESFIVTGSEDSTAIVWSTNTYKPENIGVLRGHTGFISCIAVHDIYAITGSSDTTIRKWDITTCACVLIYNGHESRVQRLICTGDLIFSTSFDKTARCWLFEPEKHDQEDSPCIRVFKGHGKNVYPIIFFSPDAKGLNNEFFNSFGIKPGDILVTGSSDSTARSWSVDTGGCLKQFRGHVGAVTCLAIDKAKKHLFTAGADSYIKVWNLMDGQCLKTFEGHSRMVLNLLVTPKMFFSSSSDLTVRSWVFEIDEHVKVLKEHQHSVATLYLKEDILWTGCGDTVIRAYDAKSGVLRRVFVGHEGVVSCVCVIGGKLYSGSSDGTLRVWKANDLYEGHHEVPAHEAAADLTADAHEGQQGGKIEDDEVLEDPPEAEAVVEDPSVTEDAAEDPPVTDDSPVIGDSPVTEDSPTPDEDKVPGEEPQESEREAAAQG